MMVAQGERGLGWNRYKVGDIVNIKEHELLNQRLAACEECLSGFNENFVCEGKFFAFNGVN